MTDFLVRHFIRDYQSVEKAAVRTAYGIFASVVGIICNTFLFLVKFLLGIFLNSVSVTADAFNNLSDAASSIISFVGVSQQIRSTHSATAVWNTLRLWWCRFWFWR